MPAHSPRRRSPLRYALLVLRERPPGSADAMTKAVLGPHCVDWVASGGAVHLMGRGSCRYAGALLIRRIGPARQ
jgi:hypothetical protein